MTANDWLKKAKKRVSALDAELMILMAFRGKWPEDADRSYLAAHGDEEVSLDDLKYLTEMLVRRIKKEPMAYILGEKEFYGRWFWVTPEVLIPRPETESLIDLIKELELPKQPRFLEIGTGSGCIAITLALEYPQAKVMATDISEDALDIASENDVVHEGRIELIRADLIADLAKALQEELEFDVVVANLPYVDPEWEWLDKEALGYEPQTALYVAENNGLGLYRRMFEELKMIKAKYVVVEADPCQHEELKKIAEKVGWECEKVLGYGLRFKKLAA